MCESVKKREMNVKCLCRYSLSNFQVLVTWKRDKRNPLKVCRVEKKEGRSFNTSLNVLVMNRFMFSSL